MNWDRIEGNWKQLKGRVQQQWGKLTDDDFDAINGKRVEKGSAPVHPGDVITLPKGEDVLVIELVTMPIRRGPPNEAQACYIDKRSQ